MRYLYVVHGGFFKDPFSMKETTYISPINHLTILSPKKTVEFSFPPQRTLKGSSQQTFRLFPLHLEKVFSIKTLLLIFSPLKFYRESFLYKKLFKSSCALPINPFHGLLNNGRHFFSASLVFFFFFCKKIFFKGCLYNSIFPTVFFQSGNLNFK